MTDKTLSSQHRMDVWWGCVLWTLKTSGKV